MKRWLRIFVGASLGLSLAPGLLADGDQDTPKISMGAAVAIAEKAASAKALKVEEGYDLDGDEIYNVELINARNEETKVKVGRRSGKVLDIQKLAAEEGQNKKIHGSIRLPGKADFPGMARVSIEAAIAAEGKDAAKDAGEEWDASHEVFSVELMEDKGILVYEIEDEPREVKVDAGNGKVLSVELPGAAKAYSDDDLPGKSDGEEGRDSKVPDESRGSPAKAGKPRAAKISVENALLIAEKAVAGKILRMRTGEDDGEQFCEVTLIGARHAKSVVTVDRADGRVLRIDKDDEEKTLEDENSTLDRGSVVLPTEADYPGMAKISMKEALAIAGKEAPKRGLWKELWAELKNSEDSLAYWVHLMRADKSESRVWVDAGDGKVLSVE